MGEIIYLNQMPRPLELGDRKENLKKRLEPIHRKRQEVEKLKQSIKEESRKRIEVWKTSSRE